MTKQQNQDSVILAREVNDAQAVQQQEQQREVASAKAEQQRKERVRVYAANAVQRQHQKHLSNPCGSITVFCILVGIVSFLVGCLCGVQALVVFVRAESAIHEMVGVGFGIASILGGGFGVFFLIIPVLFNAVIRAIAMKDE